MESEALVEFGKPLERIKTDTPPKISWNEQIYRYNLLIKWRDHGK